MIKTTLALVAGLLLGASLAACGGKSTQADADAGPVGTYDIDHAHLTALFTGPEDQQEQEPSPDERASLEKLVAGTKITLDVTGAGDWTLQGEMGGTPIDDAGTWKVEDGSFVLQFTRERGAESKKTITGSYAKGVIRFLPGEGAPGEFRYVRR